MFKEEMNYTKLMLNTLIDFCENNRYEIININVYRETATLLGGESFHERIVEFDMSAQSWI